MPNPPAGGISWEDYAPRRAEERYRIYCRAHDGTLTLIATCATAEAVGVAIVTLASEGEFDEDCALGLLDTMPDGDKSTGTWVLLPWNASAKNVSEAGRVLGRESGRIRASTEFLTPQGRDEAKRAWGKKDSVFLPPAQKDNREERTEK